MEAQLFTLGMSVISIILSNVITLITNMGKPSELKDTLQRLKLEKLETTAKAYANFGNHIIRQADANIDVRNWRGSEMGERDHAYDFSKKNIESTLFIAKIESLRKRTNFFLFLSVLLPFAAFANVIAALLMNTPELSKWLAATTAIISFVYVTCYFFHSTTITNMDQQ